MQTTIGKYEGISERIKFELKNAQESFIRVGYFLKQVRDEKIFLEKGYKNIAEYAQGEFGIGQTSAYRFMQMNDKFSVNGNSLEIEDKYAAYDKSKLQEMLNMKDDELEKVKPDMTVKDIKDVKRSSLAAQINWDFEAKVDKNTRGTELEQKLAEYLVEKHKDEAIDVLVRTDIDSQVFYRINKTYFYTVMFKSNSQWLNIYNGGDVMVNRILKEDFIEERLKPVLATSQKEVIVEEKSNTSDQEQLPGQMVIEDYPEAIPDNDDYTEIFYTDADEFICNFLDKTQYTVIDDFKKLLIESVKNAPDNNMYMLVNVCKEHLPVSMYEEEIYNSSYGVTFKNSDSKEICEVNLSILYKIIKDKYCTEDSNCDGNCFYCNDKECNSYQEKREKCLYDSEQGCSMYGAHEVAIREGYECTKSCCKACDIDMCPARCNHSSKSRNVNKIVDHDKNNDFNIKQVDEIYKKYSDRHRIMLKQNEKGDKQPEKLLNEYRIVSEALRRMKEELFKER